MIYDVNEVNWNREDMRSDLMSWRWVFSERRSLVLRECMNEARLSPACSYEKSAYRTK